MKRVLNSLKDEKSLYLLQHADNLIQWISWGEFLRNKESIRKPLLISIGYSSCHWCHVMAEESFKDENIADFINEKFIPIKIDREEYPDLDKKYQFFAQVTGQQGGWPLTIFADTDGSPFYAGTYFPKEEKYGIPSFLRVLQSIVYLYNEKYEKVKETIENYGNFIKSFYDSANLEIKDVNYKLFKELFDLQNGGLKGKTKFPNVPVLEYLLLHCEDPDVMDFLVKTANSLCLSGIFDHIDGGFFRYTVDNEWNVPHFEKMLYDNALNLSFLSKMYQLTENYIYLTTAKKTADFCIDFFDTENGFGASYDADSLDENDEKKEGYYYLFTEEILSELSVDEAKLISKNCYFNHNHIRINNSVALDDFKKLQLVFAKISSKRTKLKKRPLFDDKVIFSWNSLMIKALVDFYEASGDEFYLNKALDSFFRIFHSMYSEDGIKRISYSGVLFEHEVLEDYVYFLSATNKIFDITKDKNFLGISRKIIKDILKKFFNNQIFWYNKDMDLMDIFDDALPSSLGLLFNEVFYLNQFIDLEIETRSFLDLAKRYHSNYPFATVSLGIFLAKNYIK